jgi:tetratricopeptide (TPR) repeat protein
MNLDKLKESARKYEQSGQWRPAIDVYKKALREFEESGEGVPDPSLYNRIGDLEMKAGETGAAVRAYEQAADLYTEQGFFNNAIALCGKILRVNAGRTATYLRLAQLNARKNFAAEARRNLGEYLDRMTGLHHADEALAAVRAFADQFGGNADIGEVVVELLRERAGDGDSGPLARLAADLDARSGGTGRRAASKAAVDEPEPGGPVAGADLVFLDVGVPVPGQGRAAASVEGLELDRPDEAAEEVWRRDVGHVEGMEPTDVGEAVPELLVDGVFDEPVGPDGLPDELDVSPTPDHDRVPAADPARSLDGLSLVEARLDVDADPEADVETFATLDEAVLDQPADGGGDLVFLPVEGPQDEAPADLPAPEAAPAGVAGFPADEAALARERARRLAAAGDAAGGIAALERALELLEAGGRYDDALEVAADLTRLEPDAIYRYQKRVELAYRSGRRDVMLDSYLRLAEALLRGGGRDHALTVYRRVLEHDPGNEEARAAVASLTAPARETFVDLGSLILDEPQVRDTRMRVDQQAPIEDEDQAFLEALSQFKRGIEENLDAEDFQAHYDLGIAFKEMGLLDEAIAQFQKALRSPEGRLKTSEQLGIAFFEKARFAIAEAVLRRAIDSLPGGDEEKVGLIYWLGRAVEAQRRHPEAVRCYERVLAVDIRFLDVGERVHRLGEELA